jgi:hypothetical protein
MTVVTMHDLVRQMHINLKRSLQNCYAPDGEPDMRNPQVSARVSRVDEDRVDKDRRNFREVVASGGSGGNYFREVVPILGPPERRAD